MRTILLIIISLFFLSETSAQKFLQLERVNSPKTKKYFPGTEVTFQLSNGQWYTRVLEDVSYESNMLIFPRNTIHLDSIMAFRTFDNQRWSRGLSNQLFNFAAVWSIYTVIDQALRDDPFQDIQQFTYIVPASSVASSFLLRNIFKKRTFKLEKNKQGEVKKWRLRILDLTVDKQKIQS
ncbi:MAG: hypothetical protein AAFZ15_17220 [Bacteroidota bacterium]